MNSPRESSIEITGRYAGLTQPRRLAVYEWGETKNSRVAICVHGMSRNARDFDWLARRLSLTHRVIAIDCPGRGRSDWLADPSGYQLPTYVGDLADLLSSLRLTQVDWIGTSMGGLIGMAVASGAEPRLRGQIRRLVLNDVGPFLPGKAMDRIGTYVGRAPRFRTFKPARDYQSSVNAEWAAMSKAQRDHVTFYAVRPHPKGGFEVHYDPHIADVLHAGPVPDLAVWERWDAVKCPVLVLRGAESDILLAETVAEMQRRGPPTSVAEIPGVGHTPSLMKIGQIGMITRFLAE